MLYTVRSPHGTRLADLDAVVRQILFRHGTSQTTNALHDGARDRSFVERSGPLNTQTL